MPSDVSLSALKLDQYLYQLPDTQIALYPIEPRDQSRLLVYDAGQLIHTQFFQLANFLPPHILLVYNDTKVIPARLYFRRSTGALIEIFLLQPENLSRSVHETMRQQTSCTWQCLIGNKKKWKEGEVLTATFTDTHQVSVTVKVALQQAETNTVHFSWSPDSYTFSDILPYLGEIPLPPYLHRKATSHDTETYQTVYSQKEGAVAAPTAGLHFTPEVFQTLKEKGIDTEFITLHVGAGTFQPIKTSNVVEHPMHTEQLIFSKKSIRKFLDKSDTIFVVGTTSMRSMESLYWYGVLLLEGKTTRFFIEKLYPYQPHPSLPSVQASFEAVYAYMESQCLEEITGETQILIVPGYSFRVCKGLITNFHQPESTLILLIAAFIGEDWRHIYTEALQEGYRFLSYGDSSLLMPSKT